MTQETIYLHVNVIPIKIHMYCFRLVEFPYCWNQMNLYGFLWIKERTSHVATTCKLMLAQNNCNNIVDQLIIFWFELPTHLTSLSFAGENSSLCVLYKISNQTRWRYNCYKLSHIDFIGFYWYNKLNKYIKNQTITTVLKPTAVYININNSINYK